MVFIGVGIKTYKSIILTLMHPKPSFMKKLNNVWQGGFSLQMTFLGPKMKQPSFPTYRVFGNKGLEQEEVKIIQFRARYCGPILEYVPLSYINSCICTHSNVPCLQNVNNTCDMLFNSSLNNEKIAFKLKHQHPYKRK